MASSSERKLNVKFVGETTGLKSAVNEVESAINRLGNTTKNLAAAFGLAFGASTVVNFLKSSADAAAEDERAQKLLALAITDNTSATTEQIAQTEKWITQTQNATGVLDDHLRPALAAIIGATHDVGTAQQFMQTALDISAARGLDVETVALAITKAYNGQTAGLGRLGIQTKSLSGDTLDFTGIMQNAVDTYGGAAAAAADTTSGKLAILNAKFSDMKEQIGNEVLPIMIAFESFMLEHIIPVIAGASLMFQQLPGNIETGVAVALNNLLSVFTAAANTVIGAVNVALAKLSSLPIFGVAGLGNILKYGGGILGGLIGGGSSKTQLDKITAPTIDVPYFPSNVTLPGAIAGLGGAAYDPNVDTLGIGATGAPRGAIASGGGGGAKGGKTDAEKRKEADDKAIAETLKIWANFRDNMREIQDNMYDNEQTSYEDYKAILQKRLSTAIVGSDEWTAIQKRLTDVTKAYQDKQVADAKQQADDLKKISDQRIKDAEDAANKLMEIQDNEFEVGAISTGDYIAILQARLGQFEQFTNEWTRIYEEIQKLGGNPGVSFGGGGTQSGGPNSLSFGRGEVAAPITVAGNIYVQMEGQYDPNKVVEAVQKYAQPNGGIRIPGGVVAV